MSLLHLAAREGDVSRVQALLTEGGGVDPDAYDAAGGTALLYATDAGHVDVMHALLRAGARADVADKYGLLPLVRAAEKRHIHAARVLVDAGARLTNVVDYAHVLSTLASYQRIGLLELETAVKTRRLQAFLANASTAPMVALLLDAGADPNAMLGCAQMSVLQIAAHADRVDVMRLLLDAGADPNLAMPYTHPALQLALGSWELLARTWEAVTLLLDAGATWIGLAVPAALARDFYAHVRWHGRRRRWFLYCVAAAAAAAASADLRLVAMLPNKRLCAELGGIVALFL